MFSPRAEAKKFETAHIRHLSVPKGTSRNIVELPSIKPSLITKGSIEIVDDEIQSIRAEVRRNKIRQGNYNSKTAYVTPSSSQTGKNLKLNSIKDEWAKIERIQYDQAKKENLEQLKFNRQRVTLYK